MKMMDYGERWHADRTVDKVRGAGDRRPASTRVTAGEDRLALPSHACGSCGLGGLDFCIVRTRPFLWNARAGRLGYGRLSASWAAHRARRTSAPPFLRGQRYANGHIGGRWRRRFTQLDMDSAEGRGDHARLFL